jgi:hypothetical protein
MRGKPDQKLPQKLGRAPQRRAARDRAEADHRQQHELEAGERERRGAGVVAGLAGGDLDVGRSRAAALRAVGLSAVVLRAGRVVLGGVRPRA